MNKLKDSKSPYLLQHANNPVDWWPWGDTAFEEAAKHNLPVLVSIGYAACHWCHVMAHESFDDKEVAEYMNTHFVCIKVDREEHPDVDHIYMDAIQALTGHGGWPLNIFVTADKRPFYGGTYFPPQPMYQRPSWMQTLQAVTDAWNNKREEIESQSLQMVNYLKQINIMPEPNYKSELKIEAVALDMMKFADKQNGGFGSAPKFPNFMALSFLLTAYWYTKNADFLNHTVNTLKKIINSGSYDLVAGGMFRYATDDEWKIPHFEKMLYDQALFISVLSDAFKLTKETAFKNVIKQTIDFCYQQLFKDGGFMSAIDADSEHQEGKYYTWDYETLFQNMSKQELILLDYFDISESGNWNTVNILHPKYSKQEFAEKNNITISQLNELLIHFFEKLENIRQKRIPPLTDDKQQLSWNALMNIALFQAANALQDTKYKKLAEDHFEWMWQKFYKEDKLYHIYYNAQHNLTAHADDWALLINVTCNIAENSQSDKYWRLAKSLLERFDTAYNDDRHLFYNYVHNKKNTLPINKKEVFDSVVPSSNAVMAENLLKLGIVFEKTEWIERSKLMIASMNSQIEQYPLGYCYWSSIATIADRIELLQIIGERAEIDQSQLLMHYLPHYIILTKNSNSNNLEVLLDKEISSDGYTSLYTCGIGYCNAPIFDIKSWLEKNC